MIIFNNLPLPPSSNHQYISFLIKGTIRHAPSGELKKYKRDVEFYWLQHKEALKKARLEVAGKHLHVEILFFFDRKRLFTKDNRLKKLDVSNRLKAIHDCLADGLQIDDSAFIKITATKIAVTTELERADVFISEYAEKEKPL